MPATPELTSEAAGPPGSLAVPSLSASLSAWLPSRPASVAPPPEKVDLFELPKGATLDDFVVEATLGRGAFGVVYRAHQVSLGRVVALKIVKDEGRCTDGEGRSLAQLFHPNIVQVYSEVLDRGQGVRLLAMQYVGGTTLADVIRTLGGVPDGRALIDHLDSLDLPAAAFDPEGAAARSKLLAADCEDVVCRIGEQLASALHHAHKRGVLHRDIKPANVLIDRYGRPLLADFNLATSGHGHEGDSEVVGGTLSYMAPEHLRAFLLGRSRSRGGGKADVPTPEAVDERSDVFSLAVLLWQLRTGSLPFPMPAKKVKPSELDEAVVRLIEDREHFRPDFHEDGPILTVLRDAVSPRPEDRPLSAEELRQHLAGVRQYRRTLRVAPPDPFLRVSDARPLAWMVMAGVLPQVLGSVLQIVYNDTRIIGGLSEEQRSAFVTLVWAYNLIVYPVCLLWIARKAWQVMRPFGRLRDGDETLSDAEVSDARKRSLKLPFQAAKAALAGWLPGVVFFPLGLSLLTGPVGADAWFHFAVSFLLAGSVAATYSNVAVTGVVLRAMYPRFWLDRRNFHRRASRELARLPDRLRRLSMLASAVPLLGAVVLVLNEGDTADAAYRYLAATLILWGAFGATFVGHVTRRYIEMVYACRGTLDDSSQARSATSTF